MDTLPASVTVFPDRARVTRTGHVKLEPGIQRLEIGDLPLALVPESVRASGRGAARARLLGVSTRLENFAETPAAAARELEQQIQSLEDSDAELAARAGVLEKEQKSLDTLAAQSEMWARGLALRNRTLEEQGAVFAFVRERMEAGQGELLKIARERRELAQTLDRLRRELKNLQSARPKQRYVVTVELDVSAPGEFELALTYVVRNAGWKPLYDLRLAGGALEVTYLAQVAQNTGEDWPDVALTLSTAEPVLSLVVPELDPWYIAPAPPPVPVAPAAPKRALARAPAAPATPAAQPAAAGLLREEQVAYEPLALESAAVSEAGAALTYAIGGRADVPGNNDPRKVTVAVFDLDPELDYVTAPRREQACYRRATLKNTSPYTLLPGPAQLFEGDGYLGATQLEFAAPHQKFELALGADERMRVEREMAARDVDKTFIGDRRRLRYAYTIKLENLRDAAQVVVVRDQLPVPRDEQIKVRLESADPKPAEHTELNQLEWRLTLDRGAKQTLRFDFSVEFPRAMDVLGLP
jgi:uncharacterized protein (TIGR02231 family)